MKHVNPRNIWNYFVAEETRSSALLIIAGVLGLFLANSYLAPYYFKILGYDLTFGFISMDVKHWINEGLMAVFFLVVSLEIKRELIDGELRGFKKASFPVFAAIGGMLLPAIIFSTLNQSSPQSNGWAIPMATDIAIAIGVLGLLGNRISRSLRVFLLTLAIVDDVGSIVVIGLFYSQPSNTLAFLIAVFTILVLAVMRRNRYWIMWFGVLGFLLWYLLILSGIPGTIAGVIVAFLAPLKTRIKGSKKLQFSEVAEDILLPFSSLIIVPLFVLANAGIPFDSLKISDPVTAKVFIGVFLGLAIGKPLGIFTATKLVTLFGLAKKPTGISWNQIVGTGFIAGIGFTVSLLISDLAYKEYPTLLNASILGIFTASIVSGTIGVYILSSKSGKT